eukprot:CAMPEP_0179329718 /NCGR_PEP_ID=MMETSP0797-20121207/63278_1 /TAXON_ID=47934 /ORGANISM="Dinophysis acuminata, Strain DAEP01" /LENGTH=85 /DNA_ID=CAMNT_0021042395 /DNA_START=39 /DNA_END=296 /DNA_ORIENTATION=-
MEFDLQQRAARREQPNASHPPSTPHVGNLALCGRKAAVFLQDKEVQHGSPQRASTPQDWVTDDLVLGSEPGMVDGLPNMVPEAGR